MPIQDGTAGSERLEGGTGQDSLFGFGGDDTILGAGGADVIVGGPGNDSVDGGAAIDRVVFSGSRADYRIFASGAAGQLAVLDLNADRDGLDLLEAVEVLQFADLDLTEGVWISDAEGREDSGPIGVRLTRVGDATTPLAVAYVLDWGVERNLNSLLQPAKAAAFQADLSAFHALSGVVNFAAGAHIAELFVTPLDEDLPELQEWLTVRLTSAVTPSGTSVPILDGDAAVAIIDDDAATLSFEEDAYGLGAFFLGSEADGNVRLWVLRSGNLDASVSVDYSFAMGSPGTAGTADLAVSQPLTGTLLFANGETRKAIDVLLHDDDLVEPVYEDFKVTLSNPTVLDSQTPATALLGAYRTAYASIADDDSASIQVSTNDALLSDADEGGGRLALSVTFGIAMLADGTATPALAFSPTVDSTLTLTGGVWSAGNTVYTATYDVADTNVDVDAVSVTVSGAKDAAGNAQAAHTGEVEFGIDTLNPTVAVDIVDASLNDGDTTSVVTFTFSESPSGFTLDGVSTVGGIVSGLVARAATGGLVWEATFTATEDHVGAGSVTVGTGWSDAAGNTGVGGADTVAIDRGAGGAPAQVGFSGDASGSEASGPVEILLSRSGSTSQSLTVTYTLLSGDQFPIDPNQPWGGFAPRQAASAEDFGLDSEALPATRQVVFQPGQASATITLPPADDDLPEPDEWLTLRIDAAVDGDGQAVAVGARHALVQLFDDDAVSLTVLPAQGAEGGEPITVTVQRSGNLDAAFSVAYAFHGASRPFDFSSAPASANDLSGGLPTGTLHFAAGARSATVQVTPVDDSTIESTELLELRLSTPVPAAGTAADTPFLIAPAALTRLTDNDAITLEFEDDLGLGGFFLGEESAGVVRLWVLRHGLADAAVQVDYALSMGAPGKATADDLTPDQALSGTLSFAAGQTRKSIDIAVRDDAQIEDTYEDFKVTLSNPRPADGVTVLVPVRLGGLDVAYASIADDDALGRVEIRAYDWKTQSLLPGVIVVPGVNLGQPSEPSDATGRTVLSGEFPQMLDIAVQRQVPPQEASSTADAVNLQDAVAILKMVAGLPVNGEGRMTSPYQSRAADFDQNGMVSLADAIGVLRHSVGLPTDQVPKWIFFNEADGDLPKQPILSPGTAIPVRIDTSPSITTGLVGVLRGDVDGSWEPPATLHRLLDDRPEHLNDLVARFLIDPDLPDISLAQWGIYPP